MTGKKLSYDKMKSYIDLFMGVYKNDKNSRYRSYDYAHNVFISNYGATDEATLDYVALHLFAFLGSWGMICRGSNLMLKDYKTLINLVKILYQANYFKDIDIFAEDFDRQEFIKMLTVLISNIEKYFVGMEYYRINGKKEDIKAPTITEIGKILMVTFGCLPAYDSFVCKGLKAEGVTPTISVKSLNKLIDYCEENKSDLQNLQDYIKKEYGVEYSIMKIIDMYTWEYGFELEGNDKR